jgi:hypothetical protein
MNSHGTGKIRLVSSSGIRRCVEIRKGQSVTRICHRRHGRRYCVARKVHPFQEMSNFISANAEHDPQHFRARRFQTERGVQARSALLNHAKMKRRRVGNHLNVIGGFRIRTGFGNRRKLPGEQIRQRLREGRPKIRVGGAAVPRVPTRIHCKLRQVGQPSRLLSPGSLAARQSAKPVEIHWFRSGVDQISVQELGVARLIQSIAGDTLCGIAAKILKRRLIGVRRRRYSRQFRVLLPEIGLNQLRCGYKSENRDIAARKLAVARLLSEKSCPLRTPVPATRDYLARKNGDS